MDTFALKTYLREAVSAHLEKCLTHYHIATGALGTFLLLQSTSAFLTRRSVEANFYEIASPNRHLQQIYIFTNKLRLVHSHINAAKIYSKQLHLTYFIISV